MEKLQEVLEHLTRIKEVRRRNSPFGLPPGESPKFFSNEEGQLNERLERHIGALAEHLSDFVALRNQLGRESYEKVLADTKKTLVNLVCDAIWMVHGYDVTAEEIFAAIPEK